jgi:hypothetical protein
VAKTLGKLHVPDDLFPNQDTKAKDLILKNKN